MRAKSGPTVGEVAEVADAIFDNLLGLVRNVIVLNGGAREEMYEGPGSLAGFREGAINRSDRQERLTVYMFYDASVAERTRAVQTNMVREGKLEAHVKTEGQGKVSGFGMCGAQYGFEMVEKIDPGGWNEVARPGNRDC